MNSTVKWPGNHTDRVLWFNCTINPFLKWREKMYNEKGNDNQEHHAGLRVTCCITFTFICEWGSTNERNDSIPTTTDSTMTLVIAHRILIATTKSHLLLPAFQPALPPGFGVDQGDDDKLLDRWHRRCRVSTKVQRDSKKSTSLRRLRRSIYKKEVTFNYS